MLGVSYWDLSLFPMTTLTIDLRYAEPPLVCSFLLRSSRRDGLSADPALLIDSVFWGVASNIDMLLLGLISIAAVKISKICFILFEYSFNIF